MATHTDPRVAVVTGGARGIGRAIGEWFLRRGYKVALLDRDRATLDQTIAELARSDTLLGVYCDVSDAAQVEQAAAEVLNKFGRVDALVNNAGVAVFKPALETSFEEWRTVMATNLDGAFLCTQAFGALMVKSGGGAVVNIASISGLRASTLRVAYSTSKAALIQLTKQYAVELGNVGVRVNVIAPGPVDTEMAKLMYSVAIRSDYYDAIPLGRYGTTELEANKKAGLITGYAVYSTQARSPQEPDLILAVTYANMAALDKIDEAESVAAKLLGPSSVQNKEYAARESMREVLGGQLVRELTFK
jgi:meso-butanediol dehydrogenase/(S,S)-butanediol dehydrogenase/diacetyl reductase